MQRGILLLNKPEVDEIFKHLDISKYEGYPLEAKLLAAKESTDGEIDIELSAEEVEVILDTVAIPTETDTDVTKSLRDKTQSLLYKFRGN